MKNRNKFFVIAMLFCCTTIMAQQKGQTNFSIQWNAGVPMGSLKDVTSETSLRGFKASVLYGVSNNLSIGLGTGFQDFYQKYPRQLYKLSDGSDLSAVRSFSIQTTPILAEAKWNFTPEANVQPYAALGIGGNLIGYKDYVGEFGLEQTTKFGFAARPDVGVYIPFRKGGESGFTIGASYNVMPFKTDALTNLNHIGIHAGISIPMRK